MWKLGGLQLIRCFVSTVSLYQMKKCQIDYGMICIGRALDYRSVIDNFVAKNRDLRKFEMHVEDWEAIVLVTHWLKSFHSATTQMSATKHTMLSSIHAIYHGLQESLCQSLWELPNSAPDQLKLGLTCAHWKLSDYYGKVDDSPYYTWASCEYYWP